MRWTPLTTRTVVGVGVTSLVVAGAAVGAQVAQRPSRTTSAPAATAAAAAAVAVPAAAADTGGSAAASASGPAAGPAASDGSATAGTGRKNTPTTTRAGLGRLRTGGPAGKTIVTVTFRKGVKAASAAGASPLASTARGHGATKRSVAPGVGAATYTVPTADVDAFLADMAARPEVAGATRAHLYAPLVVPTDTDYATQQKTYLTSIAAPTGWDYGRGNASVKIAVVDTGVDVGHPDLVGKVVDQYDTVTDTTDVTDGVGHGTFVAGVAAAATNNAKGIAGVGFNSSIVAVKVADADGFMSDTDVAEGIRKAADLGAKVINISLGSTTPDAPTTSAVAYAQAQGALVVASAGNSGQEGNPKIYPAAYPGVLSVGATDAKGHRAFFSEHGTWVSMAAPGMNIRGTTPRTLDPALTIWSKPSYDNGDGTSFAAPMVAGAAALLAARSPGATAAQIKAALVSTAHGYAASYGLGKGQLDVAKAMAAIVPTTKPTIVQPADGATLTDSTSFVATSGYAKGSVAYFVDGTRVGLAASGAGLLFHPHGWSNGPHTLEVRNCTAGGLCAASGTTQSIVLDMAAPVISSPLDGASLTGSVTPTLSAGDLDRGLALFVDGTQKAFGQTQVPELNLGSVADGSHTVEAVICNFSGTRCAGPHSPPVTVTTTSLRPKLGTVTNPVFSPNGDGIRETVTIPYTLPTAQTVTIRVLTGGGTVVRSVAATAKAAGTYSFVWNGKTNSGAGAGATGFFVRIETSNASGAKGLATTTVRIDATKPGLSVITGGSTVFYPVVDTYKDAFTPEATVGESATLTLTVRNSAGTTVRSISKSVTRGRQSVSWDGKNSSGALVPAGTYTWRFTATDKGGSKTTRAFQTVIVSKKKLTTFTKVVSKGGTARYDTFGSAACATATHTGSTYAAGLWLKNNCARTTPQFVAAYYSFAVPGAVSYTSFKVATSGRSHSQPAEVAAGVFGTQIDAYDLTYPPKKVTVATTQTVTLGTITGPGHAPGKVVDVLVYVPNDAYGPLTDWDIQTVKLTVTYKALA